MKKVTLVAFLILLLVGFGACTSTHDCQLTGLAPGQPYEYSFNDQNGDLHSGSFASSGSIMVIAGVDSSVDCSSISIRTLNIAEDMLLY